MKEAEKKPDLWECEMCDGVGWHEAGVALKNVCEDCDGCGVVDKSGVLTCASEIHTYIQGWKEASPNTL